MNQKEEILNVNLPLTDEVIKGLKAGMNLRLYGKVLVARDAAHKRIVEALNRGEKSPVSLKGQVVYYMGPSPAKPGQVIGAAGPTTSGRMDVYVQRLLAEGLKGMIGKGSRSQEVNEALRKFGAVYLASIGGAGAYLSKKIKKAHVLAYEDLGAEALMELEVEDFPVLVVNDIYGGDLYQEGMEAYKKK